MSRVRPAAEPNVFGYNPKQKAKTEDVNRDIINATNAIRASVDNANSNKTAYVASGLALVVIAALAYQNYSQTVQINKYNNIFEKDVPGSGYQPPMFDGGPRNEVCLDILLPKSHPSKMLYADKYANFWKIVNNASDDEKVKILSEFRSNAKLKTPNGQTITLPSTSKLGALIATSCDTTLTNFEDLYSKMDSHVLFDALQRSADVANYNQWKKLMEAYKPHIKGANDYPHGYALRISDPYDQESTTIKVKVQVGNNEADVVFDSRGKLPIDGYVSPQAALLKGIFQKRIVEDDAYPEFVEAQLKEYLEAGDQDRIDHFVNKYPTELEQPIVNRVLQRMGIEKDDEGNFIQANAPQATIGAQSEAAKETPATPQESLGEGVEETPDQA